MPTPMFPDVSQEDSSNNIHLMCDIETMGTSPTAPVLSIGAVLFDPLSSDTWEGLHKRSFLRTIDIEDAVKHSSGIEANTLKWWLKQSDAAIKRLVMGELVGLQPALNDLFKYALDRGSSSALGAEWRSFPVATCFWANSPSFDYVILEHSAKSLGMKWPFFFSWYRDTRTLYDVAWPNGPDDRPQTNAGVHHDARDDAISQALMVQAAYKQIGLSTASASFLP